MNVRALMKYAKKWREVAVMMVETEIFVSVVQAQR